MVFKLENITKNSDLIHILATAYPYGESHPGKDIGFLSIGPTDLNKGEFQVSRFEIDREYRGHDYQIGRQMMDMATKELKEKGATILRVKPLPVDKRISLKKLKKRYRGYGFRAEGNTDRILKPIS